LGKYNRADAGPAGVVIPQGGGWVSSASPGRNSSGGR